MKLKIKICGMCDSANILEVAETKPDYMGFIYYEGSPRFVGKAFQAPKIDENIKRVGVFVNQSLEVVLSEIKRNRLMAVQLHGTESPEFCHAVIKSSGTEVIKAFSISTDFDFGQTNEYQSVVSYYLFDTKGKNYGGTGVAFDWSLIKNYTGSTPFFLSGGISKKNIKDVAFIKHPRLYALDLNSGVEDTPGIKDIQKIITLIEALKDH